MSHAIIPADLLASIALNVHDVRRASLVSKYYNDILIAVHRGLFSVTFLLDEDEFGVVLEDEWDAIETVENLFPGIKSSCDREEGMCTFSWFPDNVEK